MNRSKSLILLDLFDLFCYPCFIAMHENVNLSINDLRDYLWIFKLLGCLKHVAETMSEGAVQLLSYYQCCKASLSNVRIKTIVHCLI